MMNALCLWFNRQSLSFKFCILSCGLFVLFCVIFFIFKNVNVFNALALLGVFILFIISVCLICRQTNSPSSGICKEKKQTTTRVKIPDSAPLSSLTLEANNKNLPRLFDFLTGDMNRKSIDKETQFKLIMVAEEIFSNIAQYAYAQPGGTVDITTRLLADDYIVCFADEGKKFNPLKNKTPNIKADIKHRNIGGLGVFLSKKLSNKIEYTHQNGQNILTVHMKINKTN